MNHMEPKSEIRKDHEISRRKRNLKRRRRPEMQEKEGNPVPKQSPSPIYPESLSTFLLVLVMPAARNCGPRFIKANHPQICGVDVCEYGEERVSASSAIFSQPKFYFVSPLLNVVRNCVKVLSICCCTKFVEVKSEQLNSITYARNTRTNSITLIPPLKIQVAFQIYRVARMYFYHSETNCCL